MTQLAPAGLPCSSPAGHAAAWCPRHGREDCWRCHAAVRYVAPPPGPPGPGEHIWCDFDEAETTAPDAASHDPPEDASAAPGAVQVDAEPAFPAPAPATAPVNVSMHKTTSGAAPGAVQVDAEPAFPAPPADELDLGAGHDDEDDDRRSEMTIKTRSKRIGEHVTTRVFAGRDAEHLRLLGTLTSSPGEAQVLAAALTCAAERFGPAGLTYAHVGWPEHADKEGAE